MNINKINQRWPISCRDSLAAIDHMSVSDALEIGLITKEESEFICDDFVMRATIAMETKGYSAICGGNCFQHKTVCVFAPNKR